MWSDFQDILISEKSQVQKSILYHATCSFFFLRKIMQENTYVSVDLHKIYMKDKLETKEIGHPQGMGRKGVKGIQNGNWKAGTRQLF